MPKIIIIAPEIEKVVDLISKDKDVLAVFLYGSYARNGQGRDIDLCVFFQGKNKNIGLSRKRLAFLSKAPDKFDIQVYQLLPLYVRVRVLKEGKMLFVRDELKVYDLAYDTIREFNLFEPHYKDYIEVRA